MKNEPAKPIAQHLVLGVRGSIAAYRAPDFLRQLLAAGYSVDVALSRSALQFVTPKTLETFGASAVWGPDSFGPEHQGTDHIATARRAHAFIVYGATADFLARYALGMADDFLCLQLLATETPVIVAPAMNPTMWTHPAVQANVARLIERGVKLVGPISGTVACGETGVGHVASHGDIVSELRAALSQSRPDCSTSSSQSRVWKGQRILLSLGGMATTIDGVRDVVNRSTGRQGLALARALREQGAELTLLVGRVSEDVRRGVEGFHHFQFSTSEEYGRLLAAHSQDQDGWISAAAILDFEIEPLAKKIKRKALQSELSFKIRPVPDFLKQFCEQRRQRSKDRAEALTPWVVGFALEAGTEAEILRDAQIKRQDKGCDLLCLNQVSESTGPESSTNRMWVLSGKETCDLGFGTKDFTAQKMALEIYRLLDQPKAAQASAYGNLFRGPSEPKY